MQKPENKGIKEFIQERVAEELAIPLEQVEFVVSWAYKNANKACETHKEIELSGIGKLMLSPSKLRKRIKNLEGMNSNMLEEDPRKKEVMDLIKVLKTKLDGN